MVEALTGRQKFQARCGRAIMDVASRCRVWVEHGAMASLVDRLETMIAGQATYFFRGENLPS
jgi:hypothetical protein